MASPSEPEQLAALVGWYQGFRQARGEEFSCGLDMADWLWLTAKLREAPISSSFRPPEQPSSGVEPHSETSPTPPQPAQPNEGSDTAGADPPTPKGKPQDTQPEPAGDKRRPKPAPSQEAPSIPLLNTAALPDQRDVAESLQSYSDWLVANGGQPLRLQSPPLFPSALALLKPLKPLLIPRFSHHQRRLDEERSAERSAELGIVWPVFRPGRQPGLRVRLVLDAGMSMVVWRPHAEELKRVLTSSYSFAEVILEILPLEQLDAAIKQERRLQSPIDGFSITLLISDTAGLHWWDRRIQPWLAAVGVRQPMAVIHTLPYRYRRSTALREGVSVTLSNQRQLASNANYRKELVFSRDPWAEEEQHPVIWTLPEGAVIPVISLNPKETRPWAALAMGDKQARCPGVILPPSAHLSRRDPDPLAAKPSPDELIKSFRGVASSEAQMLLAWMAGSPAPLTLGVLRLLQGALRQDGNNAQPLAEVMVSGLLERLPGQEGVKFEELQFQVIPEGRALLQKDLDPAARQTVLHIVTQVLERHWNRRGAGPSFEALISDPGVDVPREADGLVHVADLTANMIAELPGRQFRGLAQKFRKREKRFSDNPLFDRAPLIMLAPPLMTDRKPGGSLIPQPSMPEKRPSGLDVFIGREEPNTAFDQATQTMLVAPPARGMIKRTSMRGQRPSALDVFTGREPLIAAFMRNLAHKKPEEHRVLVFYGDGGMGKSTLLQKLEQIHRERCPQALMGRLDLAGADTTPPDLLLYRLRRPFPTIPFPNFSLALAEYGRRFRPEQVYGNDRKELLKGAGPYADALASGLEVLAKLSGVDAAVNAMKAAATAQRLLSDWVQRRAEPWLQRSQSYSEEQLLAQLPRQWARDFRQALSSHLDEERDDAITYSGPPPLIFLDTYETLWHAGMGKSHRRREPRERWLVDLVSELPEVLWVIGGRDRLSWEEGYDRGWHEVCEQHLVGQLSEEDARSFLAKRGIEEPAIVERILRQAAGVPFYLELETQLYDKTPFEERTPEVFGGSHHELIDRLLTHLDASERATLRLLAAFGIWDQELFRQAVTHFATGYPARGAAELGRSWSIESIGDGRWQLHKEMVHHLQADERQRDSATFEAVHRWGFAYFDGPLEVLEAKTIQAEDAERLQQALSHARIIQPAPEWSAWLVNRLVQLEQGTIWQPLLAVVEIGVQQAELELGGNHPVIACLLNRQALLLGQIALYEEADSLLRRALAINEASYGPDHPEVAILLSNLATLLKATNRLADAEPLMRRALAIDEASYGTDHPNVARDLNNLAMLLLDTNRPSEAESLIRRAMAIDEASYGPDHPKVAIRLNNLARLLHATNHKLDAELLIRRALAIDEASYGPDHPNVAIRLDILSRFLHDTGLYDEAENHARRALSIDERSFGPDHPNVAFDLNSLAKILKAKDRLAESEALMQRSLDILRDFNRNGHMHPKWKRYLDDYTSLLKSQGLSDAEARERLHALYE